MSEDMPGVSPDLANVGQGFGTGLDALPAAGGEASANLSSPAQSGQAAARDVRVAININQPVGASVPQALQRSSRQIASAVRRAVGTV